MRSRKEMGAQAAKSKAMSNLYSILFFFFFLEGGGGGGGGGGWGVPAFTSSGYQCQDLSSPCDGMRVCKQTRYRSTLSFKRVFREWSQNPY